MKKIAIISCFDAYTNRIRFIEEFFSKKGDETVTFVSDFDHMEKRTRNYRDTKRSIKLIHVPGYKKNLSFSRIFSHIVFSIRTSILLEKSGEYDLVYVLVPPNSLCYFISKLHKKMPFYLVYDIYDMWPESLINGKKKSVLSLPFKAWSKLRNGFLGKADYIFYECGLYKSILESIAGGVKSEVLYITKKMSAVSLQDDLDMGTFSLCYLGSINNIIDIDLIVRLIKELNKIRQVRFYIVGDGEKREELITFSRDAGAEIIFCGKIYDEAEKRRIFSKCHFGLNLLKKTVCVGLTQKSLDYFEAGLPVINSIPFDTSELIREWDCGLNIEGDNISNISDIIRDYNKEDYLRLRNNTKSLFTAVFDERVMYNKMENMYRLLNSRAKE